MGRQHPTNPNIDGSEWKLFVYEGDENSLVPACP